MNTAVTKIDKASAMSINQPSNDHNNQAIDSMLRCAQNAVDGLRSIGLGILAVTVHGARPVIDVMATAETHLLTLANSSDWQSYMGKCPATQRLYIQTFVTFRGCLVTWIKWR